jgi:spore coat protein U-like protein
VKISKMIAAASAAAALVSMSGNAAPPSAQIHVSAKVDPKCTITAQNMDFLTYDPLAANKTVDATATANISVNCTKGSPNVTVALDNGLNSGGTGVRKLINGTETLTYVINDDAGIAWTQTLTSGTVTSGSVAYGPFASVNTAVTHAAHGILAAGQDVSVGTYVDTLTATVLF